MEIAFFGLLLVVIVIFLLRMIARSSRATEKSHMPLVVRPSADRSGQSGAASPHQRISARRARLGSTNSQADDDFQSSFLAGAVTGVPIGSNPAAALMGAVLNEQVINHHSGHDHHHNAGHSSPSYGGGDDSSSSYGGSDNSSSGGDSGGGGD